jgi:hypothetical protein
MVDNRSVGYVVYGIVNPGADVGRWNLYEIPSRRDRAAD